MHRDTISNIQFSQPTNFLITASIDGHVKFWKKKDKDLSSAADTGGKKNNTANMTMAQKAKMAQESGKDLTFLGESIEFVKQYRSHIHDVTVLQLSNDQKLACTACAKEKSLKVYDVGNFDMISIHKFTTIRPNRCVFTTNDNINRKFVVAADETTGTIEVIDIDTLRHELKTEDEGVEKQEELPTVIKVSDSVITSMFFHESDQTIVLFHLNGAINFLDPETRTLSKRKLKNHQDLYNLQKDKTFALSTSLNAAESKFAVYCADKSIRVFNYNSGKQIAKIDESIEKIRENLEKFSVLDKMEFEQRVIHEMKLEKEIKEYQDNGIAPPKNICSDVQFRDLDGDLLIYPTVIGLRMAGI